MSVLDQWVASCLLPLAVWILLSGLDDLLVDLVLAWAWLRARVRPRPPGAEVHARERRIAIFVPLWREHAVIGGMLEHNLAAIRYRDYEFFIGCYPNDEPTLEAVREAEDRFPKVHLALCPHDGPTSKADCLNWIYQRMLLWEDQAGVRFEIVVTHDAEDLIHPEELAVINRSSSQYSMVQVPVLPLPTPFRRFTHGVYCDEFAEFQTKDLPVRQLLGGFLPSNGVGTGYARRVLDILAGKTQNRVFDPECLTEDYEIGLRMHLLGCAQQFVPIRLVDGAPVATREYFPQRLRQALRQRTRWLMGNALQAWERHGWRGGGPRQLYWLWRDRKGLVGNPVSFVANLLLGYGVATWAVSAGRGVPWALGGAVAGQPGESVLYATLALQAVRIGVRAGCVARIYGWRFAAGVPLRILWANWINFLATACAALRYARARWRGEPLVWLKTEHAYPSRAALVRHKRPLGEVLVAARYLSEAELGRALASKPVDRRLGEHLVDLGLLDERELYQALSMQHNVPFRELKPGEVPLWVARALPASVARRWQVLPVRIAEGRLYLAGPELPGEELQEELRRCTDLEVRFQYTTPANLRALSERLLGQRGAESKHAGG